MKILLIQAPLGRPEPVIYPAGLSYLAGSLRNHEVVVTDPNLSGSPAEALALVSSLQPDLIGVSLRNIDSQMLRDLALYLPPFYNLISSIKTLRPNVPVVVGGAAYSLFPIDLMASAPEIDVGVYLEGELTLRELAEGGDPSKVKGVFYRQGDEVLFTGNRKFRGFHELPKPAWDIVSPQPYAPYPWAVGVQTKRGCSRHCSYCTYPLLNGRIMRCRSPQEVVDEIELLATDYGIKEFMFIDPVFNNPPAHAEAIVRELLRRSLLLRWTAYFSEKQLTRNFADLAISAGCREFAFSPDGTTAATLKALGKDTSPGDFERVLRILDKTPGMKISAGFFMNPPDNHGAAFLRLLSLFFRCKVLRRSKVAGFILACPRVEPQTELERRARAEGIIPAGVSLLPRSVAELRKLFYHNRKTPYAEWAFQAYIMIWKVNRWLRTRLING